MPYALTERERQVFWAYYNAGKAIIPTLNLTNGSTIDALHILERVEDKLMKQAHYYLHASEKRKSKELTE